MAINTSLNTSTTPIAPSAGGTGVNNGVNTFTAGGNTEFNGAHSFIGRLTGNTDVTFPTSGTLATTSLFNGSVARYVVSSNPSLAPFSTIQAAINQAVSDGVADVNQATIWILPGVYGEDLTIPAYINLCAASASEGGVVNINGNATVSGNGAVSFTNIGFTCSNNLIGLLFSGSDSLIVSMKSVTIHAGAGTGLSSTNSLLNLILSGCSFESSGGGKLINVDNGGIELIACVTNGVDTNPSTINGGLLKISNCDIIDSYIISGGNLIINNSQIYSGASSSIVISGSPNVELYTSSFLSNSASTYFIDGTGAIKFDSISAIGSAILIAPTITKSYWSQFIGNGYINSLVSNNDILVNGLTVGVGGGNQPTNTAVGSQACLSSNSVNGFNTAMGELALSLNVDGEFNTAIGARAMRFGTTGSNNTHIGYRAAASLIGANNTSVGFESLALATTEDQSVAIGFRSINQGSGGRSVAVGAETMQISTATGSVAIGYFAMQSNGGGYNVAVGYTSLPNGTGDYNIAIGANAGIGIDTGSHNILIGDNITVNSIAISGSIGIGSHAEVLAATGNTSADIGNGISLGSTEYPVGFRGDGSIFPSTTGAGFWQPVINGTSYMIPLFPAGSTGFGAITATSLTLSPTTGGINGVTDGSTATAGYVGELIQASVLFASAISLTTATPADITSITLTAGDWDIYGNVTATFTGNYNDFSCWCSSTSATSPDPSMLAHVSDKIIGGGDEGQATPTLHVSLSTTTVFYLSSQVNFTTGTASGCGKISARRVR